MNKVIKSIVLLASGLYCILLHGSWKEIKF